MAGEAKYVQVLLPLKLEWQPYYRCPHNLELRPGSRVRVSFAGKQYSGVVLSEPSENQPKGIKRILDIEGPEPLADISRQEMALWKFVAEYYMCTLGEVYKMAYPSASTRQELLNAARMQRRDASAKAKAEHLKERIEKLRESIGRREAICEALRDGTKKREALGSSITAAKERLEALQSELVQLQQAAGEVKNTGDVSLLFPTLSPAQEQAKTDINNAFKDGKTALLQGVTGSGKTEVYISLALDCLCRGRSVLMMVPEIALEKQLEDRLRSYFADSLLTFHSGETIVHRSEAAEIIRQEGNSRKPYIMLGTRSSIFLPHNNLGLVIVDEEHDGSYKQQDPAPRYNGRDCASVLARLHKANLLLGSATPSLEALFNARAGRYAKVLLKEKYYGGSEPQTVVIDTSAERKKNGMVGSFSRKLIELISGELSEGGQVLLLRSRRAYSTAMQCGECGEIVKCPRCNVPLNFHKESDMLVCHYCGFREGVRSCEKCGGELLGTGAGTQKIEEEAAALFPEARIARLDSDASASGRARIIKDFSQGRISILVGTQILAKGLDFPNATLVGAIGTDSLLGRMDFRADEKTVQLLSQLRGRTGRRRCRGGLLAIQTAQSRHPVYRMMGGEIEPEALEEAILSERRAFGFPPYTRMININLKDVSSPRLDILSKSLMQEISGIFPGAIGPYAPPVDKISDNYLMSIRLNLPRTGESLRLKEKLKNLIRSFEQKHKWTGHIAIDVDPA